MSRENAFTEVPVIRRDAARRAPQDTILMGDETTLTSELLHSSLSVPADLTSRTNDAAQPDVIDEVIDFPHNPRFIPFFRLLVAIRNIRGAGQPFPKKCRVCGQEFGRFAEYLCATTPKGHVFEDCAEVMGKPFTMMYRHCPCGNTLVLSLTEEIFPSLEHMWSMLHEEAAASGLPVQTIVKEFSRQCDQYVIRR